MCSHRMSLQRRPMAPLKSLMAPPIVHEVLRFPGQPLDPATRAFMEPHFGHDFSRVKVHTDAKAAESARAVNALAYTVGRDVVFGGGQYIPGTTLGRKLLAHELTHVVQQSNASGGLSLQGKLTINPSGDAFEQEADATVERIMAGTPTCEPLTSSELAIQRATVFNPGVNHAHKPSGRWADVQANPNSSFWANRACANFSPAYVVRIAIEKEFPGKPLALAHLYWYFRDGDGADFVEDEHLDQMLRTDTKVQALLAGIIPSSSGGRFTGHVEVDQSDYQNQDFRYAFGAIDRLDFEVDFSAGVVHVWFQDRYEWHPVYPGLYDKLSGDDVRETNCVHAALVELKSSGAADFWMKGEATVPLSVIRSGLGGGAGGALKTLRA